MKQKFGGNIQRIVGLWTAIILSLIVLFGCEKLEDITMQVEFLEPDFFGNCFAGRPIASDRKLEVIITDNESFLQYWKCDSADLPEINFDTYSLIGKYTEGGGCDANYDREIIDNIRRNKIVYTIEVDYNGFCSMLITNMNWALIPRLKEHYQVEFIVRQTDDF